MAHMPREPEAFGEQVAKILHQQFPERAVELAGPLDLILSGRHLGLENLYRMVQHEPTRGLEIVENYIERLIEGDTLSSMPLPLSVAKPRIMPRIQPIKIFEHLDREQVAHVPFVNDTVIVFVIDMPQMTVSITVEQLVCWGLDSDDLDVIARENLARYAPDLQIQIVDSSEGGRAAIVARQDGYDAARLLLLVNEFEGVKQAKSRMDHLVDRGLLRPCLVGGRRRYALIELRRFVADQTDTYAELPA